MKTLFGALSVIAVALVVSTPSFADIHNGSANANGTSTGTVTSVTYGEGGKLASVTFKEKGTDGKEYTIDNNGNGLKFNDIDEFGGSLEKAFNNDFEVTLTADFGNLTSVTLKRKPTVKPVGTQPTGL